VPVSLLAQASKGGSDQSASSAEKDFETANSLMDSENSQRRCGYRRVLKVMPNDPAVLFNAGLAAYQIHDYEVAVTLWRKLSEVDPFD
jgi:hypothetical protein